MVKMPQFDADPERRNKISYEKATAAEKVVSTKDIAVAAREIEIATRHEFKRSILIWPSGVNPIVHR